MGFLDKENYFGNEPEKVAGRMLDDVSFFTARHPLKFKKEKALLLVVDAQRAYVDPGLSQIPSAPAALENIKRLIASFPTERVIFTRHINTKENAGMMSKWWKTLLTEDDPATELCVDPGNSKVIKKDQYDAFYKTELERLIGDLKVEQIVLCGFSANICCEATGYSAFMKGLEVFLVADATAARSKELHFGAVATAAQAYALPILTKNLL